MSVHLFSEFPPITDEEWLAQVENDLKGVPYEKALTSKTLDGIVLRSILRESDVQEIAPAARGLSRTHNAWSAREEVREPNVLKANLHAISALERGAHEITFLTYPSGVHVRGQEDIQKLLVNLWREDVPIHWQCGPLAPHMIAMLVSEARWRDKPLDKLRGSVDMDPIMDRCAGWTEAPLDSWRAEFIEWSQDILNTLPQYNLLSIRGALIEKAGATVCQELAFSMALFFEYLNEFKAACENATITVPGIGKEDLVTELVRRSEFRYAVGTNYFLEIAKIRAHRILIANLLDIFGVENVEPKLHVITTSSNKTLYDSPNNLLRATIEAMAAVMGGADSITVTAFDQTYQIPDEFSEHLARNTETLLRDEAFLAEVRDPLGGSYVVETLTQDIAKKSWEILEKIESLGGFVEAYRKGFIEEELRHSKLERANQVDRRKRTIVGVTQFGNIAEIATKLDDPREAPCSVIPVKGNLQEIVDQYVEAGSLGQWLTDRPIPETALSAYSVNSELEQLRLEVQQYLDEKGSIPKIVLLKIGDPKMAAARAEFCKNFFAIAGVPVEEVQAEYPEGASPELLILCGADADYLPYLQAHPQLLKNLCIAGYPEAQLDELKGLGVTEFLHIRQPLVPTLKAFFEKTGIHLRSKEEVRSL